MSWLKLALQEESSDLRSAHQLHLRVFWAGIFQSAQCWLNSTNKFTGSDSQWFIRSRARPEIRPSEEVHNEILSWGAHLLKISSWAFLLVAVERNDPRNLEQCNLVGKQMLLPWILCSWRWWNSFWGSYEKSSALCHTTCELISPSNLLSWLIDLWYLSHCAYGFEMFLLSTLGCDGQEMCVYFCSWCDLKGRKFQESSPTEILQELQTVTHQKAPMQVGDLQPRMTRTAAKNIYQSPCLCPLFSILLTRLLSASSSLCDSSSFVPDDGGSRT